MTDQLASGSYIAQAKEGATATVNVYENVRPAPVDKDTLAKAKEQLAALPDYVPDPAPLPSVSKAIKRGEKFAKENDVKLLS